MKPEYFGKEQVTDKERDYRSSRCYLFSFNRRRFAAVVDHGVEIARGWREANNID